MPIRRPITAVLLIRILRIRLSLRRLETVTRPRPVSSRNPCAIGEKYVSSGVWAWSARCLMRQCKEPRHHTGALRGSLGRGRTRSEAIEQWPQMRLIQAPAPDRALIQRLTDLPLTRRQHLA